MKQVFAIPGIGMGVLESGPALEPDQALEHGPVLEPDQSALEPDQSALEPDHASQVWEPVKGCG